MAVNKKRSMFPLLLVAIGLVLLIGAVVSLVALSSEDNAQQETSISQGIPYPNVSRVELSAAKTAYDRGEAIFVDVRDKLYYENGHIPGARSIPLSQLEQRMVELSREDWIILYCT